MKKEIEKKWYAIKYKNNSNLRSQPFRKKVLLEVLPIYRKKDWTGRIIRVKPPRELTKAEKQELKNASRFLNALQGRKEARG